MNPELIKAMAEACRIVAENDMRKSGLNEQQIKEIFERTEINVTICKR